MMARFGPWMALVCFGALLSTTVWGQRNLPTEVRTPTRMDRSAPLSDMAARTPAMTPFDGLYEVPLRLTPDQVRAIDAGETTVPDILSDYQKTMGGRALSPEAIFANFEGANVTDNGFNLYPPDTNGDVGPNHYVQMVNLITTIYDKSGNTLVGPVPGSSFWQGFGGPCEIMNSGDPVVLYDPQADRWLITQFAVDFAPYKICVACSETGDPTGAYFRYEYDFGNVFPDYPKFGVWDDDYLITLRNFGSGFEMVAGSMEREKMLVGDPVARLVTFSVTDEMIATDGSTIDGVLPIDMDGASVPVGAPATFIGQQSVELDGVANDRLVLFDLDVDWANGAAATVNGPNFLTPDPFDPTVFSVAQPGTGARLDVLPFFMMHRAAVCDFGTHLSMVANHSVDVDNTNRAGIRWYELRSADGGSTWSIFQQGTYSPDADSRWMGSIAMDAGGNIALGYSVASSNTFPSIRFTGRFAGDPAGQMTLLEQSIIEGSGVQTGFAGRWGDYSMMAVDPSAEGGPGASGTFWYTQEYIRDSGTTNWRTRIASFSLEGEPGPQILVAPLAIDFGVVNVGQSGGPSEVQIQNVGDENVVISDLSLPGGDFAVTVGATAPITIAPRNSIVLEVAFSPTAAGTQNGTIAISSNDPDDPTVTVSLSGFGIVRPDNDLCGDAISLSCGQTLSGTTIAATVDNNVFACGTSITAPGVWYTLTGNNSEVTLSTCDQADFDTKITVFEGVCGDLVCITGVDDAAGCSGFTTELTFDALAGTDYYILVHGFESAVGNFDLSATCAPLPQIAVSPEALAFTVELNGTDTAPLTITNGAGAGGLDLTYLIQPAGQGLAPARERDFVATRARMLDELPVVEGPKQPRGDVLPNRPHAPSAGMPPLQASGPRAPFRPVLQPALRSVGYGDESQSNFLTWFDLSQPEVLNPVAPKPAVFVGAGDVGPDPATAYVVDSDNNFFSVDTATGTRVAIGTSIPGPGEAWSGMAYDPTSGFMYMASAACGSSSFLYTVDLGTGAVTAIGPVTNALCLIAIAVHPTTGVMYGYDVVTDVMLEIDKSTGAGTVIGPLGFDANFGQGMDFDENTGNLYLAAFNNATFQAELRIGDVTTGNTVPVGGIGTTVPGGTRQLGWVGIPGVAPCPWLSVSPDMGTVPAGNSATVDVSVDAAGLEVGTYACRLFISSNDRDDRLVEVPVTLTVTPPGSYDIYTVSGRTGSVERVTAITDANEFNPSFSNDGKSVVHDVQGGPAALGHSLYVTDVASGVSTPLAGGEGGNDASWSPNGRTIAFDRVPVGDNSLYTVPAGGGTRALVRANAVDADWSNNSRRLVFTDVTDGSIRTVDVASGEETVIAAFGIHPAWSGNGKQIAWSDGSNLFVIDVKADGQPKGSPVQLTSDGDGATVFNQQPSWNNNGKTLVFHSNRVTGDFDLWTIPSNGGTPVLLAGRPDRGDFDPAYAKNGKVVAYAGYTNFDGDVAAPLTKAGDTGAGVSVPLPTEFALEANYPNPFNPSTTLRFALPEAATVSLKIYTITGQLVRTVVNGYREAGYHQVTWNGTNEVGQQVSSGFYLYRISTPQYHQTRKMLLMK